MDAVLEAAPCEGCDVVDLGTGTGQLAIPMAETARRLWAVDISSSMLHRLSELAREEGLDNIVPVESSIESVDFPPASVDLVVSNYALHHLVDSDKQKFLKRAAVWMKPGGRIVIGDMMFGRGTDARDRAIILGKVAALARRGPAGWWRIAKNVFRFSLRVQEHPVKESTWARYLEEAGFVDLVSERIVAEAVVLTASMPPASGASPRGGRGSTTPSPLRSPEEHRDTTPRGGEKSPDRDMRPSPGPSRPTQVSIALPSPHG